MILLLVPLIASLASALPEKGDNLPAKGARVTLPDPPPRTVTKQVVVAKQRVVIQQRLVPTWVRVCRPCRPPHFEVRYIVVEERVIVTETVIEQVQESVPYGGAALHRYATIRNLPPLAGGRILDVLKKIQGILTENQMLPDDGRPRGEHDTKAQKALIYSDWFEYPRGSGRECQMVVQAEIQPGGPGSNELVFRLDVLQRPKDNPTAAIQPAQSSITDPLLAALFKSFPYQVTD